MVFFFKDLTWSPCTSEYLQSLYLGLDHISFEYSPSRFSKRILNTPKRLKQLGLILVGPKISQKKTNFASNFFLSKIYARQYYLNKIQMSKKSFTYIPYPRILCTELYIRKQDIRIYKLGMGIAGKTAGRIGLTFFCGHSWVVGGC